MNQVLQPQGWSKPNGYANGIAARGRMVFTSGQVGWDQRRHFGVGLVDQVRQTLKNIVAVLAEAGARPEHIARLTWYIIDRSEYLACQAALGDVYREVLGNHYPAMAVVQVLALMEEGARVEIEATAVIPE